jgi:hypothetical protein
MNINDVKECFLRIKAKDLLIRLDNLNLEYKEDNFKKLFDKMLDMLLKQSKDMDSKAWKLRVTLDKVLIKLKTRILYLKKSRESYMIPDSMNSSTTLDVAETTMMRTSNPNLW